MRSAGWPAPASPPVLGEGDVHVWSAALDPGAPRLEALKATLSADESERAAGCRREPQRRRFVAGRGLLRLLLGRYLGREASELRFAYGPHGKPALREGNPLALRFSLAHSGERALVAVGRERELGVDLERLREGVDHGAIAERFFPPDEAARLRRLPEGRRAAAFFAAWVCHEARLKAQGTGLFTAPLEPTPGFCCHRLAPGPGLAAALVTEGPASPRCYSLEWERAGA